MKRCGDRYMGARQATDSAHGAFSLVHLTRALQAVRGLWEHGRG